MSEILNIVHRVYENIFKFITKPQYRNLRPEDAQIGEAQFNSIITRRHYIIIRATGAPHTPVRLHVVLLDNLAGNKIQHDSKKMTTLLESSATGGATEIIVVSDTEISSTIRAKIADNVVLHDKIVSLYTYNLFAVELPIAVGIPHILLSGEALQNVLADLHCSPKALPHIYDTDPQAIWIGARAGGIIKIGRQTDRGIEIAYRYVIRSSGSGSGVADADADDIKPSTDTGTKAPRDTKTTDIGDTTDGGTYDIADGVADDEADAGADVDAE